MLRTEAAMERVERLLQEKGREVFSVAPETSVWEAASAMAERRIGAVLVLQEGRIAGLFSERDLLARVVLKGLDPRETPVGSVMSTDLVVVTPDTPVHEAMAVMTERRCRHLPVMDGQTLAGLVSIGDCTRWVSRDQHVTIQHLTDYIHQKYPR
jgi:CBS domain-containing protein